jgi:signal transduction histidine kinase
VITDLEPATILGSFGLGGGIRRYLEQYEAKTGLKTQLRINTNLGRLPSIIEIAIFRVIQEILSNVDCHANATQVDVVVEENGRGIQFSVIDNGDGLISEKIGASRKNLGLARMVDYAELVNGDLRVLSEPGRGTQVILSVPYSVL